MAKRSFLEATATAEGGETDGAEAGEDDGGRRFRYGAHGDGDPIGREGDAGGAILAAVLEVRLVGVAGAAHGDEVFPGQETGEAGGDEAVGESVAVDAGGEAVVPGAAVGGVADVAEITDRPRVVVDLPVAEGVEGAFLAGVAEAGGVPCTLPLASVKLSPGVQKVSVFESVNASATPPVPKVVVR